MLKNTVTLKVTNTGDRAVQVGSHYHFFESNKVNFYRTDSISVSSMKSQPG